MVDDYDYRIDDADLELMYEVAKSIRDEWHDSLTALHNDEDWEEVG